MRFLKLAGLLLGLATPALAGPYQGISLSTTTGKATENISGYLLIAPSSASSTAYTIKADGPSGGVDASSFTAKYGIKSATGTFTATGATQYSVTTSSGISVASPGMVVAPGGVNGPLYGNANTATAATNISGGAAGGTPYQSAANTTAFRAAGTNGQVSVMNSGATAPIWSSFIPETVTVSTKNVTPAFNGASEFVQMDASGKLPAIDGSQLTGLGVISGGAIGAVPVYASANSFSNTSFIASVSSGVAISTNVTLGVTNSTITLNMSHGINFAPWRQHISSSTAATYAAAPTQGNWAANATPTIAGGFQVAVATITPVNAADLLIVEAQVNFDELSNVSNKGAVCLFQDAVSAALSCATSITSGSPVYGETTVHFETTAGSLAQRNFSVRLGADGGGMGINTQNGSTYGLVSWLEINEVAQ